MRQIINDFVKARLNPYLYDQIKLKKMYPYFKNAYKYSFDILKCFFLTSNLDIFSNSQQIKCQI